MQTIIRPSVRADARAIVELLASTGLKFVGESEALEWKYWQDREDFAGARSFVATHGGEIVAHAGVVPGICATDSHRATVLHIIDWAARPNSVAVGTSLMKHVARLADALVAVGGSDHTRRILPHIGFQPCGTAEIYVRVLHPLRHLNAFGAAAWKLPARFARRTVWRLSSPSVPPAGWSVRRIVSDEIRILAEALPRGTAEMTVFERSEGLFRYMLHCSIVPMELYALSRKNQVCGYFLLAFAPGQARVADCWVAMDEPAAWDALMQCAALQASRHRDVAELVAWSSDPVMTRALVGCGFHLRDQQPILLRSAAMNQIISGCLRVQMLENDAVVLHRGFAELCC